MKTLLSEAEPSSVVAAGPDPTSALEVHLSIQIAAARRCLFYALTLPEYIEAWLHMPDTTNIQAVPSHSNSEVKLQRYYFQRHVGSIIVCFQDMSDECIGLTWRKGIGANAPYTSVQIALRTDQARCTLDLTHSGFQTQKDSEWHRTMWTHSLAHLSRLMTR